MVGRIKYAMRGMAQKEFAQKLGVSPCTVSTWVNGKYKPQKYMLKKIAEVGKVPLAWLNGEWPVVTNSTYTEPKCQEDQKEQDKK